jgi:hypothetical protein
MFFGHRGAVTPDNEGLVLFGRPWGAVGFTANY